MPVRKTPIITGEYYHVFNRGVEKRTTYQGARDYQRFIQSLEYYLNSNPSYRLSKFLQISKEKRTSLQQIERDVHPPQVTIASFTLMPTHFHLLIKQVVDRGISKFVGNVTNSYTKYFNKKHKRNGPLFQGRFKAVRIESDEQLLHVSRYIHLNPLAAGVVKTLDELYQYPWSSLPQSLGIAHGFADTNAILQYFDYDQQEYRQFHANQIDSSIR